MCVCVWFESVCVSLQEEGGTLLDNLSLCCYVGASCCEGAPCRIWLWGWFVWVVALTRMASVGPPTPTNPSICTYLKTA